MLILIILLGILSCCFLLCILVHLFYCIKYQSLTGRCDKHNSTLKTVKYYKEPETFEPRTVMLRVQGEVEICSKCDKLLGEPKDTRVLDYISSFSAPQDTWDEISTNGYKIIKE